MKSQEKPDDEVVFHYTSMQSFLSIVETQSLWATSIAYLNDRREREMFLTAAQERLPVLKRAGVIGEDWLTIVPDSLSVDHAFGLLRRPFVTSFCREGDSLLHWRAYCPQQNGVAIGFRSKCLKEAQIRQKPEEGMIVPRPVLSQMKYVDPSDTNEFDGLIEALYVQSKQAAAAPASVLNCSSDMALQLYFQRNVEMTANFVKHHSFEIELEYRIVISDLRSREDAAKFRSANSCLIPYVELIVPSMKAAEDGYVGNLEKFRFWDAIATVVVGPTSNAQLSVASVQALFVSKGVTVEVIGSQVPYRDW